MATKKTATLSVKKTPKAPGKSTKNTKAQKGKPEKTKPKGLKKNSDQQKKQVQAKSKIKIKTVKTVASKVKETAATKKRTGKAVKKVQSKPLDRDSDIRKQLISKRDEIIKEARNEIKKNVKVEARQIVESALDDGDLSVIDLSQDIALKRLGAHRENLIKIDEALRKIQDGTYGVCDECGELISSGRLKVMPSAIYCRDCQEKREELEKAGGEEEL